MSLSLFGQYKTLKLPEIDKNESIALTKFTEWENETSSEFNILKLSTDTTYEEHYRISEGRQIIEVYKIGNKYYGQIISFTHTYVEYKKRNKKKSKLLFQNCEIAADTAEQIFKKFKELDNVPDQKSIDGWSNGCDGRIYTIEYANKQEYLLRNYWTPKVQSDSITHKAVILDLINYIYVELNFYEYYERFIQTLPAGDYTDGFLNISKSRRKRHRTKNRW